MYKYVKYNYINNKRFQMSMIGVQFHKDCRSKRMRSFPPLLNRSLNSRAHITLPRTYTTYNINNNRISHTQGTARKLFVITINYISIRAHNVRRRKQSDWTTVAAAGSLMSSPSVTAAKDFFYRQRSYAGRRTKKRKIFIKILLL